MRYLKASGVRSVELPRQLAKPPGCMAHQSTCGKTARSWRRNPDSVDSIFVNGYLTTAGQPAPEVWGMIEDLGFKTEVDYQKPVAQ